MKNLTKLFLAVVALFAYSCVTDTTGDLGVELGGGQTTEITLSLEESRTQLGEKVDGVYPLYWSEGDIIAVNGVASTALTAQQAGSSAATFTINGTLTAPYCIAYPAAPVGQVLFAENQVHAGDTTFGKGVSTMYAYGDSTGTELNHLTGVLKIGITGSANLTYAQISTIDRAPIAGAFALDFEKGELKATETSKSVINYSFGEGVQLSGDATYLHVAVPAGVYDELYVTLYDNEGGVMYATIKADDTKPLTAGNIREFKSAIAYAPNAEVFVVKDVASFKEFAAQAATLTKDVLFVADVDMSGEAWTPIEGYAGTLLGNGYAINGLTAPLFGTTNASFKGLHLTELNINETTTPNVGAFARYLTATDNVTPTIENCSASGKITVNCPEYTFQSKGKYLEFSVGGIIGYVAGAGVHNCVSRVDIDIKQMVAQSNTSAVSPVIGGIVGALNLFAKSDKTNVLAPMSNCVNYGDFTVANGTDNGETGYLTLSLGGCIGVQYNNNFTTLDTLTNYGDITFDANFSPSAEVQIGGVGGYFYTKGATNFTNHGKITLNSGKYFYTRVGGVIGYAVSDPIIANAYNNGDITINEGVETSSLIVGGIVATQTYTQSGGGSLTNSINRGDITLESNMPDYEGYYMIGGITGWNQCAIENCENYGNITSSSRLFDATDDETTLSIGGIAGYKTIAAIRNSKNDGDVTFTGSVETTEAAKLADVNLNIGALVGYSTYAFYDMFNEGDITIEAKVAGKLRVGGMGAVCYGPRTSTIKGNITIKSGTTVGDTIYIGGIGGTIKAGSETTSACNILVEEGVIVAGDAYIGGYAGYFYSNTLTTSINESRVEINGSIGKKLYGAGIAGTARKPITDCTNKGAFIVNATIGNAAGIGGIIGYVVEDDQKASTNLTNEAPISFLGKAVMGTFYIGGVIGYIDHSGTHSNLINKEGGVVTVATSDDSACAFRIGGAIGAVRDAVSNVTNYAPMYVSGGYADLHIGGAVCSQYNYDRTGLANYGTITADGVKATDDTLIGGIGAGGANLKVWSNSHNYGNIIVTDKSVFNKSLYVGGFFGKGEPSVNYAKVDGCSNEGNITVSSQSGAGVGANAGAYLRIGGLAGTIKPVDTAADFFTVANGYVNKGHITYNGTHTGDVMIGGFTGEMTYYDAEKWSGTIVNQGNINYNGTATGKSYVGGLIGWTSVPFSGGKVFCNVTGENYSGLGMIAGNTRADAVLTNCHCGGTTKAMVENTDGDKVWSDLEVSFENYFKYIYSTEIEANEALTDKCGYISAIDATPVDSTGAVIE